MTRSKSKKLQEHSNSENQTQNDKYSTCQETKEMSESIITMAQMSKPPPNWTNPEKIIKLGMEKASTSTFTEVPIFQQPQQLPNPFQWNGEKSTAPRWAKQPLSTDSLNHMKYNQIPASHKARLTRSMCHRQILLDGN
jgi:hypothetical protein